MEEAEQRAGEEVEGELSLQRTGRQKRPALRGNQAQTLMGILNLLGIRAQLCVRCRPAPIVCGNR